jgi:deoxyribose-phosphate aldolase
MTQETMTKTPEPAETYQSLAGLVDLHLLGPALSSDQIYEACMAARENQIRAVFVRPCDIELAAPWFRGSNVIPGSVAGYPDGTSTTSSKLYEARDLIRLGARELEFVINPARLISRQFQHVEAELLQVARSCHESGVRLTVVYNSRLLADDLRIIATKICRRVEADVISIEGSEAELVLLRPLLKDVLRLKRNAPVTTLEDALGARAAGFASFVAAAPGPLLEAWRKRLAEQSQSAPTAIS